MNESIDFELKILNGIPTFYYECIFLGTPSEFANFASLFTYHIASIDDPVEFWPTREFEEDEHFAEIIFFGHGGRRSGIGGRITIEDEPGTAGKSFLRVKIPENDWSILKDPWILIYREMMRRDFLRPTAEQIPDLRKRYNVPKGEAKIRQWVQAYDVMIEKDIEYKDAWDQGDTYDPEPKLEDYQDAIAYQLGWNFSKKTVVELEEPDYWVC